MFHGEYPYTIDEKGRLAIPARLRDAFRQGVALLRGFEKCILVYPAQEWQKEAERLASLPLNRAAARRVIRFSSSGAYSSDLDRQGRVVLPGPLRQYAGIGVEVVVVGMIRYLEIWDREAWEAEREVMTRQASQDAESLEAMP